MGDFNVIRFVNPYKNSNTFVVEINRHDIVVIDFGNYPLNDFLIWLTENNKNILGLILTHEHADHCYGVDSLRSRVNFPIYCSEECDLNMRDPKRNYSRYIEDFETFGVLSEAIVVRHGQVLNFKNFTIKVIETPGHSPGSICLVGNKIIFTGDTILNNAKSPMSFPNSSKIDYQISLENIRKEVDQDFTFFPGHGDVFVGENNFFDAMV